MAPTGRGFTLLEVITVSAIFAVVAATVLPSFQTMVAKAKLRTAARELMSAVTNIRTLARSGRGDIAGWSEEARVKEAGMRLVNAYTYEMFIDADDVPGNGNEISLKSKAFSSRYTITMSQEELRFRRNGTLSTENDIIILVKDAVLKHSFNLRVTFGGRSRLTTSVHNP